MSSEFAVTHPSKAAIKSLGKIRACLYRSLHVWVILCCTDAVGEFVGMQNGFAAGRLRTKSSHIPWALFVYILNGCA
jgi:hypothetical protein